MRKRFSCWQPRYCQLLPQLKEDKGEAVGKMINDERMKESIFICSYLYLVRSEIKVTSLDSAPISGPIYES